MNEERSNLGRIHPRIEQFVLAPRPMIAAIQRLALAPPAAPGKSWCRHARFASATKYVPSAISWLSTPNTVASALSICVGV